jgi:hypothetical protein
MTETAPVAFTEDRVPMTGIETTIDELVELYGGELTEKDQASRRRFVLPLRRGVASAGGVECTLTWAATEPEEASVTLVCDRDVDAPRGQRLLLLGAGVVGALLFTMWPFFPKASTQLGTLAWIGGAVAISVYILSLRKTSGGIGADFLQRLARRQRAMVELPEEEG